MPYVDSTLPFSSRVEVAGDRPRFGWKRHLKDLGWRMLVPLFADQPGANLPIGAPRLLLMRQMTSERTHLIPYVQIDGRSFHLETGKPIDMRPPGEIHAGDVLLWGKTTRYIALTGAVSSLREGRWLRSAVCHCGIVTRDAEGGLRVVHLRGPDDVSPLKHMLTPEQRAAGACFLKAESLDTFFRSEDQELTCSVVLRSQDPERGLAAARKAQQLYETQVMAGGVNPWYYDSLPAPHRLLQFLGFKVAPNGRGGICSTFIDLAYDGAFESWLVPTTPLDFERSPLMRVASEMRLVRASALEPCEAARMRVAVAKASQSWARA